MTATEADQQAATQTFCDVACTVCGCVCDDLEATFVGERLTHVERACSLAQPWFDSLKELPRRPAAMVEGRAVSLEAAIDRAADILRRSRAPLIWGLSRSSTAGQRAAVLLAEQLGANIDTTASVCHGPSIMAIQQVGESTCSLGEVRNRADLVMFWGANPVKSHPRHFERYSVDPVGEFIPNGRRDRTVIVVDAEETATSQAADLFVKAPRGRDFELIWALRQLLAGAELPKSLDVGVPTQQLQEFVQRLVSCRYGVVFFGLGLAQTSGSHANVEALLRLVEDLNGRTRFAARRLRIPGDVSGADSVLCWLTGFAFAVNYSRGFPRYNPGEYSANELLERGEADACVLVGTEFIEDLSPMARHRLSEMPTIALDYPNAAAGFEATVQFTTAIYGVHAAGTAYRMDEIPIPLRRLVPSEYPTDDEVLNAIAKRLT
jgi:formylmethanofuran dehydrogenase subunit B